MDCTLVSTWSEWSNKNWESNESIFFINPYWSESEKNQALGIVCKPEYLKKNYLWIASSGSSKSSNSSLKFYGFTRDAFLVSANAVNSHLQAKLGDKWLSPLPIFHVGGFSIFVRSLLLGQDPVLLEKWEPQKFRNLIEQHQISFSSLVPTQVFDIVKAQLIAPQCLKAVVVGGAKLSEDLYAEARKLKWPLLPSFGMTELCSQIATAEIRSLTNLVFPQFKILDHISASVDSDSILHLSSKSLFSICLQKIEGTVVETLPIESGYKSNDTAEIFENFILPLGRNQRFEKILSEGVNLDELQEKMSARFKSNGVLISIPESRRGAQLVWVTGPDQTSDFRINKLVTDWNSSQPGHHKLSAWLELEQIPRTPLGKPLFNEIQELAVKKLES